MATPQSTAAIPPVQQPAQPRPPAAPIDEPPPAMAAPATPPADGDANWESVEVQPGETALGSWLVGLLERSYGLSGMLTVTDRRLLFKPKVAGTSLAGMLISQLPSFKERNTVVLRKDQIAAVRSDKGLINTKIWVTAMDGASYIFNRGVASADPILAAIEQGR